MEHAVRIDLNAFLSLQLLCLSENNTSFEMSLSAVYSCSNRTIPVPRTSLYNMYRE
jgi:hypothetical protein